MADATTASATETVSLEVTRQQAAFIAEGMEMLLNCKRFSFKGPDEDTRELHAEVFAAVESVQEKIKQALAAGS